MGIHSPIVSGSRDVVNKLNTKPFHHYDLDQIFFITFDFSSLYTSIKKWTVFNTIHFLCAFLKLDKQLIYLMKDLFNFIKNNAYFTVGNCMLYLQQEGFAMGSYDSMDGANLVPFKSKFYIWQNQDIKNHIVDFYRFIDDGSLILRIAFEDIKSFLEEFASYYPKDLEIEFKVSKFQTNFTPIVGVCNCSMFCCTLLYLHSSIAIILMGKRELIALLNLSSWCLVMVERLFLAVPRGCLQFVIVVFPDHTHLLFFSFWS